MRTQDELVEIVAQRHNSGARVNHRMIAAELGEDRFDVLAAYKEFARRLGYDPLLHRAEQQIAQTWALAGLPPLR